MDPNSRKDQAASSTMNSDFTDTAVSPTSEPRFANNPFTPLINVLNETETLSSPSTRDPTLADTLTLTNSHKISAEQAASPTTADQNSVNVDEKTTCDPSSTGASSCPTMLARDSAPDRTTQDHEPETGIPPKKSRIQIISWQPVITWAWKIRDKNCAICKRELDELCMYCVANSYEKGECRLAKGKCGHAFHDHCISSWVKTKNVCPIDNTEWKENLLLSHKAHSDHELNDPAALLEALREASLDPRVEDASASHNENSGEGDSARTSAGQGEHSRVGEGVSPVEEVNEQ